MDQEKVLIFTALFLCWTGKALSESGSGQEELLFPDMMTVSDTTQVLLKIC